MHNIWKAPTRPSTLRIYRDTLKQASKEVVYEIWTLGPRRFFTFESSSRHFQQWERDTILNIVFITIWMSKLQSPNDQPSVGAGDGVFNIHNYPTPPPPTRLCTHGGRLTLSLDRANHQQDLPWATLLFTRNTRRASNFMQMYLGKYQILYTYILVAGVDIVDSPSS